MRNFRTLIIIFLLCCSATLQKVPYGQNLIVLLIDGLGRSLLNQSDIELFGFRHVTENGARAEYLKPTYPTQSYPNWMSLFSGEMCFLPQTEFQGSFFINRKQKRTKQKSVVYLTVQAPRHFI
ncbi:unnamed protein product [Toxocara canis]|uniref:Metalloenzyme domain-containing protein n=1 Tax=Toxocara canis TaxID=6265 RepID=A0A183UYC1_TOXCA|nr:unnamed protein product [Toxocara canis]